ncbi:hypothetical protein HPB47_028463, partial [Ixodes persulcatus]
ESTAAQGQVGPGVPDPCRGGCGGAPGQGAVPGQLPDAGIQLYLGAGQPLRVPRLLRLRAAAHPAVSERPPRLLLVPPEADLLPDLPRAHRQHPQPGNGEGGQLGLLPVQVLFHGLPRPAVPLGEARARGDLRVQASSADSGALRVSVPWGFLQVAGILGPSDGPPGPLPQVHHHPAG